MSTIDPNASALRPMIAPDPAKSKQAWLNMQRLDRGGELPSFESFAEKARIEFKPIEPVGRVRLESKQDMFTGAEMNSAIAQDESVEGRMNRARDAAEKLVSSTLVEPILKQVRESNNTPPPFGPGKAEKQFGSIMDAKLANQIVSSAQFPLVQRIQRDLLQHSGYMNDATKAINEHTPQRNEQPLDLIG